VPLGIVVLREERWRWAWLYGLAFGVVYFGVELSWIFLFGWMAWTALTFVLALYVSVATFLAGVVRRTAFAPLLVAGLWAGMELWRDRWPVGGYPWGSVGTTQVTVPGVRWLAGVVGVYGLSFLIVFAAATAATLVVRRSISWRSVAAVAAVLFAFVAIDVIRYGSPSEGRALRVAVIQGDVPRPARADQDAAIARSHLRLTRELLSRHGPVDLVVWPESSTANTAAGLGLEGVEQLAAEVHTPFLAGRSFFTQDAYFNLMEYVTADGRTGGTYSKRHPVPFGEYVPFGFLRRFVGTLQNEIPVDQKAGTKATVFHVNGTTVATPICFESVFPRDFLDFVRKGAELFVLSTNNSSFERSYASQQHIAHTRMRALETRQWVVQAALSGISGVLGPDGSLSHTTKLFTPTAFVAEVRARRAQSLYASTGDLFPAIFAGLAGIGVLIGLRRRETTTGGARRKLRT
jgi:apolipoprotein N-acyltransferase